MLLVPATGLLLLGHYYYTKVNQSRSELEEIDKCRSFLFDFVNKVEDLPSDKTICLQATVGGLEFTEADKLPLVNGSLVSVEQSLSQKDPENDSSSELVHNAAFLALDAPFQVQNSMNQRILVFNDNPSAPILFHNIRCPEKSAFPGVPVSKASFEERVERLFSLFDGRKYEQKLMGLEIGESYTFIGKISKLPSPVLDEATKEPIVYGLKPVAISANQRDYVMKYLDDRLGRRIRDTKVLLVSAVSLGMVNHISKKLFPSKKPIKTN